MTIKDQIADLEEDISYHLSEIDVLSARIKTIQTRLCKHPNEVSFSSGDYSGDTYTVTKCPDCGRQIN